MLRVLWVCLAGGLGAGTRYLISLWAIRQFGTGFPFGTLIVNVAGCFLMGAIVQASVVRHFDPSLHVALTAGFLGGLTTYSSFNYEATTLVRDGSVGRAVVYVVLTGMMSVLAGLIGCWVARRYF